MVMLRLMIRARCGQRAFDVAELAIAVDHIIDRGNFDGRRLLRHVRELPLRRQLDSARIRRDLAANRSKESRLATAVSPDEPRLVADGKREIGAVEELFRAARKRQ